MSSDDDDAYKLFRIRKTIMEMLRDRGYLVLPDIDINITMSQFKEKFGDKIDRDTLVFTKAKNDDPNDQIYVFFCKELKVGVKLIKHYLEKMHSENVKRGILVVQQSLSHSARTALQNVSQARQYLLEVFLEGELLFNITQHMLVPKHEVLSNKEKTTLLERYSVKATQLPRIQVTDPVARYFGVRRGQIMKITRQSETAGEYETYRHVV